MTANLRAYLLGIGAMAVTSSIGLGLALASIIENWNFLLLGSVFLAGFVTALSATSRRFWLALGQVGPVLVIVLALFTIGFRYAPRWENADFGSAVARMLLFIPLAIVLCAAGGGL